MCIHAHVDFGVPGTVKEFNVYGPPETPALVSAAYDYIRIPYGIFAAEPLGASTLVNPFKAHVIDDNGLAYQDDKIRVTAAENTHYQLLRPRISRDDEIVFVPVRDGLRRGCFYRRYGTEHSSGGLGERRGCAYLGSYGC
jgi:hypothetical protein